MRNPTVQIKQAIKAKRYEFFAKITFADSTELVLDQKKIWQDGFVIDRAVSGQSAFEFGACVIGQFTLILNNAYGDFDGMSFDGAVVQPYVEFFGIPRWRIFDRWSMGEFAVDEVDTNDTFVKITCLDSMSLLDRPYSDVVMAYPASLYNIVNGIATVCGLTLRTAADWLPINDYTVTERPSEETLTCRDVLSYVCQATGNYAIINTDGELYIGHYDGAFLSELGDDYDDYNYHLFDINKLYQFSRDNAQVMLTGVSIEVEQESYTAGTDEYMVHVKDNPMINPGAEQTFANALNTKINGWNFRPFNANHEISLLLEVGDNILLKDVTGKVYKSVVTRTEFSAGRHQTSECNAEPASLNASTRYSLAAKAAAQEVKVYDGTVNNYIDLVTKAYGMYRSAITDPDDPDSKIYAFHNEEAFSNSTFCMFENGNGIQVGRRDSDSDPWVYTSADVEDAVVLAQTLVTNTAIINQLFARDIAVAGALHSADYVAALPGASPPYSQAGMGLDFGDKEFETENFAIDSDGKIYAKGGSIGGWSINPNYLIREIEVDDSGRRYWTMIILYPQPFVGGDGSPVIDIEVADAPITPGVQPSYFPRFQVLSSGNVFGRDFEGTRFEAVHQFLSKMGGSSAGADDVPFYAKGASGSVGLRAARTDSTGDLFVGVGTGGTTYGMWSNTLQKWMVWGNSSRVKLNGLSEGIDATATYTDGGTVSTSNATWKAVQSIQLDPGAWQIEYGVSFGNNANGYRAITLSSAATSPGVTRTANTMNAVNGTYTVMNASTLLEVGSTTTYYLYAYQNSGGNMSVYPFIRAIKLK